METNLVQTVDDLFKLTLEDLIPLERMADKSARNTISAIKSSKQTGFARFLFALGIRNVGEYLSKVLENQEADRECAFWGQELELRGGSSG